MRHGNRRTTRTGGDSPLPKFFELLNEAQSVAQEVDDYDLDSSVPSGLRYWRGLLIEQRDACVKLHDYVKNTPELRAFLIGLAE